MNTAIPKHRRVCSRVLSLLATLILVLTFVVPTNLVIAQDQPAGDTGGRLSEVPSFGGARPGPILPVFSSRPRGFAPLQIQIDRVGIDAPVERGRIDDGVMADPSGPWVVTWYDQIAQLGQGTNVVMAGHVDYWDTGPAVFAQVPNLVEGDIIRIIGENDKVFEYEVQWTRLYNVAEELTPEVIQTDIVGDTKKESLTLITCGGAFNYDTGEYISRLVIRATKI